VGKALSAFWPGWDTGACQLRWGGWEQLHHAARSWRVQTGPGSDDDWNSACRGETYRCCVSGFWWHARKEASSAPMVCEIRGSLWEWWEGKQKRASGGCRDERQPWRDKRTKVVRTPFSPRPFPHLFPRHLLLVSSRHRCPYCSSFLSPLILPATNTLRICMTRRPPWMHSCKVQEPSSGEYIITGIALTDLKSFLKSKIS
jgi:hypothetical protein